MGTIFNEPQHPYTQDLIGSIPVLGEPKPRLATIPGVVPSLVDTDPGCRFSSRCVSRVEHGLETWTQVEPDLIELEEGHKVRCWLYQEPPDE